MRAPSLALPLVLNHSCANVPRGQVPQKFAVMNPSTIVAVFAIMLHGAEVVLAKIAALRETRVILALVLVVVGKWAPAFAASSIKVHLARDGMRNLKLSD